jgi:MarR family transcriptional regulator, organic hydroperoxide resistance regulator
MRSLRETADYPLDQTLDFLRLLWAVEHGLQRASKRMEASLGVTGPQRLVLRIVGRFPGISAGTLAHIVQLHPRTITGILQRLVRGGLLRREPDPDDNRRVRLRLRPRGEAFTRSSRGTVERAVTQALNGTSGPRVKAARKVLAAVGDALKDLNEADGSRGSARSRR